VIMALTGLAASAGARVVAACLGIAAALAAQARPLAPTAVPGLEALGPRGAWALARPLFETHCGSCHGARRPKAGIVLAASSWGDVRGDAERWTRALRQVEFGAMPPASRRRQPTTGERALMAAALRSTLTAVEPGAARDPGRPTVRRLTPTHYANAVRDLLGVDFDARGFFPADAQAYGFDSVGDTLFVPPLLFEKYVDAAASIVVKARETAEGQGYGLGDQGPGAEGAEPSGDELQARLARLLRRGFRRPPTGAEVAARVALVESAEAEGRSWRAGLEDAVRSVLLSPHFLFRIEGDRDLDEPWRISDHELAVRLSFFLWAAPPDAELDALADSGRLAEPEVLAAQVGRMLVDDRAASLADDFAAQWLGFGQVRDMAVDFRRFPAFRKLRWAMVEEASRFFSHVVRENRPVLELLDADYTFANGALARHYGLDWDSGREAWAWQRVALPDRRRGGVLGMAAVLTATSEPLRTNPVRRGAWVLRALLGTDPPPPPANAGVLPEDDRLQDGLTLRERLERHRAEPQCASCHAHLDPLGLALEGFDGIGAWREADQGKPVDAATVLADGTRLSGVVELKDWLLGERDRFVRSTVSNLFTYALGRPPTLADEAVLREVEDGARAQGYRFHALVMGIATSYPFTHRRR